nr:MAG TPA: hypothetical protein [Caudoviricetes sp.]
MAGLAPPRSVVAGVCTHSPYPPYVLDAAHQGARHQ